MFILVIFCFTGTIKSFVNGIFITEDSFFNSVIEEDYLQSQSFVQESERLVGELTRLIGEYKNEEHILNGGSISEEEMRNIENNIYHEYFLSTSKYNPNLTEEENVQIFKEEYADQIKQAKEQRIKEDLKDYHTLMQSIEKYDEPLFYASDGTNVFTNTTMTDKEQFAKYPAYLVFGDYKSEIYPKQWQENNYLYRITDRIDEWDPETTEISIAYTKVFLDSKVKEWEENKAYATKQLYAMVGFSAGLLLSFLYLILVIGRKSFNDERSPSSFR